MKNSVALRSLTHSLLATSLAKLVCCSISVYFSKYSSILKRLCIKKINYNIIGMKYQTMTFVERRAPKAGNIAPPL